MDINKYFMVENIKEDIYLNITDPNVAYILGFIWSDGHLELYENNKGRITKGRITINIISNDCKSLQNIFNEVGIWTYHNNKELPNRQLQTCIRLCCLQFATFLKEHDYKRKSKVSPTKILSIIPDNIKLYFFRGIIDGDGCWYYNKDNRVKMLQITSTYEQDWKYMIDLCNSLNIIFKIDRTIRKNGNKHSDFRITQLDSIKIIGNYLYNSFENDKIGLERKYYKYKEIITKFTKSNFSKEFKLQFINLVIEGKTNKEICNILNIKKKTCEYLKSKSH